MYARERGVWRVLIRVIFVQSTILILEKDETDLERTVHYLWATGSFFLGQTSKSFKPSVSFEKTRFTVGCLDPGPQPGLELEGPERSGPHRSQANED